MATKSRLFLDTSALFAGIWSAEGGARMLLCDLKTEAEKDTTAS